MEQNMVLAVKQPDLSVNKATADMENKVLAKKIYIYGELQ